MPEFKNNVHSYNGSEPFAFISYSHDDLETISGYLDAVDENYRFWYDEGIKSGAEWVEEIGNKIFDCDIFIVFLSHTALQSHYIKDEITYAYKYAKKMMAVLLEPLHLPRSLELILGRFQYINFYEESDYSERLNKFVQGIPDSVRISGTAPVIPPDTPSGVTMSGTPDPGTGKTGPSVKSSPSSPHTSQKRESVFSYRSFDRLYEIVKLLAEGGCGKVYRVKSNRTGAEYIMKRMMYDRTNSTQLRMNKALFRNELQKLLLLNNKYYTPTVIDFIETDESSSLIMSEISGINLRDLLTFYSKYLNADFVITMTYKISLLLHDIHKAGLVYGDVKPSNFILNDFGQLFVIDLGSMCAISDPNYLKVHTPKYSAPEQVEETTTSPDYRFDVYGLGVLFKEFLDATTRESTTTIDYATMDKCRKIIRKMTEPVPNNRYETIGEVTAVLDMLRPAHGDAIMRSFANTIDEWDVDKLILSRRRSLSKDGSTTPPSAPILHNYGEEVTVLLDESRPSFNYNDDKSVVVSWN